SNASISGRRTTTSCGEEVAMMPPVQTAIPSSRPRQRVRLMDCQTDRLGGLIANSNLMGLLNRQCSGASPPEDTALTPSLAMRLQSATRTDADKRPIAAA